MVKRMFKKGLVVGIIVLFITLSVAPSINANIDRLPVKSKLVETAVRIHRANGITPYTLKLTEKESDEVERIFDNLKVSLDTVETGEEIDEIYDDAVESLYELGMFPRMTLKEAKQLVKGKSKSQSSNVGTADENFNCKIAGKAYGSLTWGNGRLFRGLFLFAFIKFLMGVANFPYFNGRIGRISFGHYDVDSDFYLPAEGWVHTNGSNGVIKWEGEFYGNIDYWEKVTEMPHGHIFTMGFYKGVHEFNGVFIDKYPTGVPNFLGNAEHVRLSYTPNWP